MLGLSPESGAGSCARLPARFWPRRARPGVGGRTPPSAPATHSRSRKTTGAGLPPASHPGGSPTSSTLARGGGLYAKGARPGAPSRVRPGRGWSAEAGPSPSPLRPGRPPGVAGTAGPGSAPQLPQDGTPAPARRPLPSRAPRARRAGGAGRPAAGFTVPSASRLCSSRVLLCSPGLGADARAAMAAFCPLQNERKSRAGER